MDPEKKVKKKRKFTARIPPCRVKKVMQVDEEIGRMTAAVPVVLGRAMEHFAERYLLAAGQIAIETDAKTLTLQHLKQVIDQGTPEFSFLQESIDDLVSHPGKIGNTNRSSSGGGDEHNNFGRSSGSNSGHNNDNNGGPGPSSSSSSSSFSSPLAPVGRKRKQSVKKYEEDVVDAEAVDDLHPPSQAHHTIQPHFHYHLPTHQMESKFGAGPSGAGGFPVPPKVGGFDGRQPKSSSLTSFAIPSAPPPKRANSNPKLIHNAGNSQTGVNSLLIGPKSIPPKFTPTAATSSAVQSKSQHPNPQQPVATSISANANYNKPLATTVDGGTSQEGPVVPTTSTTTLGFHHQSPAHHLNDNNNHYYSLSSSSLVNNYYHQQQQQSAAISNYNFQNGTSIHSNFQNLPVRMNDESYPPNSKGGVINVPAQHVQQQERQEIQAASHEVDAAISSIMSPKSNEDQIEVINNPFLR